MYTVIFLLSLRALRAKSDCYHPATGSSPGSCSSILLSCVAFPCSPRQNIVHQPAVHHLSHPLLLTLSSTVQLSRSESQASHLCHFNSSCCHFSPFSIPHRSCTSDCPTSWAFRICVYNFSHSMSWPGPSTEPPRFHLV